MNEEKKKNRKEWVKTAAIVFLSVMLVLTFFSNTIMNYSLPEVATQYVQSGTITAKVRGSGTVESNDPYEVTIKETRKVASVAVKAGDIVQQGDVLVYLADQESEELEAARTELETAQDTYNLALASLATSSSELGETSTALDAIQTADGKTTTSAYVKQILTAQTAVDAAQADVDTWRKKVNDYTNQISIASVSTADTSSEQDTVNDAKETMDSAEYAMNQKDAVLTEKTNALTSAQAKVALLETQIEALEETVSNGDALSEDAGKLTQLREKKKKADQAVITAQLAVNTATDEKNAATVVYTNAKNAYTDATNKLTNKQTTGSTETTKASLEKQKAEAEVKLSDAQTVLADKQAEIQKLNDAMGLTQKYKDIMDAQEKVSELTAESIGATVTADIAGTVTSINATAGKEISAADTVAVIQPEGKGYTMSFSVTNDQAKKLSVGDVAELVNSWNYDDVTVTLASIKPDTTDPSQKKLLTFDVTGTGATAGQSLSVSVGQKSGTYDLVVPNSAIREDNNGKFILIVETKSTPLSNRYIATRVDVEVLASDDTSSAVSGALYGYEYVITTSTAPVEAGKQVRLANETS